MGGKLVLDSEVWDVLIFNKYIFVRGDVFLLIFKSLDKNLEVITKLLK